MICLCQEHTIRPMVREKVAANWLREGGLDLLGCKVARVLQWFEGAKVPSTIFDRSVSCKTDWVAGSYGTPRWCRDVSILAWADAGPRRRGKAQTHEPDPRNGLKLPGVLALIHLVARSLLQLEGVQRRGRLLSPNNGVRSLMSTRTARSIGARNSHPNLHGKVPVVV
jgi:hypothetical protein